ncbi:MAG: hypothetical protein PHQ43_05710 [Dehalococcoidales bacterium]|nr:hypothetical protein [Dehalococcoidales bacterium]
MIELLPGDIILFKDQNTGFYGKLKRWLMRSDYGHGSIYIGNDYIVEAIGKACCRRKIENTEYKGWDILVLRLRRYLDPNYYYARVAASHAEYIADSPKSGYDYLGIVRFVIPRLILYRLTGKVYSLGYYDNKLFWCFELCAKVYQLAKLPVISHDIAMASDFIDSNKLDIVHIGPLSY